ncbi:MAG: transposase [Fuerstiella sp.]
MRSTNRTCLKREARRLPGRDDVVPGMIAAIQSHGELPHWHPHTHVLITCGAFTPTGDFIQWPQFDLERSLVAWQEQVFTLYLAQEKIEPEVVEKMRSPEDDN